MDRADVYALLDHKCVGFTKETNAGKNQAVPASVINYSLGREVDYICIKVAHHGQFTALGDLHRSHRVMTEIAIVFISSSWSAGRMIWG